MLQQTIDILKAESWREKRPGFLTLAVFFFVVVVVVVVLFFVWKDPIV